MALYLFRFDDICPTMDWNKWEKIESILDRYGIKPIVAIVPDNRDTDLIVAESNDVQFWEKARSWQTKGWVIGLHGLHHLLASAKRGLVFESHLGEFRGAPYVIQRRKITTALEIMTRNGLYPSIWVAPQHAFDSNTLLAVKDLGFKALSDGFYYRPVRDAIGLCWIPQQFWRIRHMPFGLWTICFHPNSMDEADLVKFEEFARTNRESCNSNLEDLVNGAPNLSLLDSCFSFCFRILIKSKATIQRYKNAHFCTYS